ncbi:MAG: hypothetical protein CMJ46_14170 [Planctomyces sp.]|nr:hypothetical protein [Planctomyces sp.]
MKPQKHFQHRLQTLSALHDAVGAMRSLSAHHYRQSRQALLPARQYREEINAVIAEIGINQSVNIGIPGGLLVIGSDLGLCGDYNSQISDAAMKQSQETDARTVYAVGKRGESAFQNAPGIERHSYDAPVSTKGLIQLLSVLAEDLISDYLSRKIGSLHVVSAQFDGVGHFTPISTRLLPIESVSGTQRFTPSPYVAPDHLRFVAIREFLFITLYEILLEANVAEHGMRLLATESALDWLEENATSTSHRLATARTEAATQELLDIVSSRRRDISNAFD